MRYGRRADLILKVLPLFLLTTYHFSYDWIACHCVFMFVCVPFVDRENLRLRQVRRFLRCSYARTPCITYTHTQEHRMNDKDKGRSASEKVNGKQIERNLGSKCSSSSSWNCHWDWDWECIRSALRRCDRKHHYTYANILDCEWAEIITPGERVLTRGARTA